MKKIIFDTDLGGDCDDVMALDLLLAADRYRECRLIGVSYSSVNRTGIPCIHAILRQHGYGDMPLGRLTVPEDTAPLDAYATAVADAFPAPDGPTYESTPDAVRFLRSLLAKEDKVTLVMTGFLTNLANLLSSAPDDLSPLDGVALVREKVEEIAMMACDFRHITGIRPDKRQLGEDGKIRPVSEYNIAMNIPAAQKVFALCPVPIVCSPFELGFGMITGKSMCEHGQGKVPDSYAYVKFGAQNGRHSWDPATALYGVYGAKPWYYVSAPGTIRIAQDGVSDFIPDADGLHRILIAAIPQEEIAAEIDRLVMRLFA